MLSFQFLILGYSNKKLLDDSGVVKLLSIPHFRIREINIMGYVRLDQIFQFLILGYWSG